MPALSIKHILKNLKRTFKHITTVHFIMNKTSGFTLFELLITLFISAVLTAIAIPQYSLLAVSLNQREAELQLLQDLKDAQLQSVREGCKGIITVAADNESYKFGCDYVPYSTSPIVEDSISFTRNMPNNIKVAVDAQAFYNSRGQVTNSSGVLATRTFTLTYFNGTSWITFNTGTLRATGFFSLAS